MSGYQNTNTGAQGQHVGIGTKIKDAVTPGTHNTGEYIGERGGLNAPTTGGQGGGLTGANPTTTGHTGTGVGGTNVGNTGYNQGATTGTGGAPQGQQGLTGYNQSGTAGSGLGGGVNAPQEHFEKKTHNTHDHDENESYETSTKRL
jgi:hypothetical protein